MIFKIIVFYEIFSPMKIWCYQVYTQPLAIT